MSEQWRRTHLPDLVQRLTGRPGHEAVRTAVSTILTEALGLAYDASDHEVRRPEIHGRLDTLIGNTVFEYKSDLRREQPDVDSRLPDYLQDRQRATGRATIGIATDGATFIAYETREGKLAELSRLTTHRDRAEDLLAWLESGLTPREDLPPDPLTIMRELGRGSIAFGRARALLTGLWASLAEHPEAKLKRQLWDSLLAEVYGTPGIASGDDDLFLQHTYLTIVAKTIAAGVLDLQTNDADAILSGQAIAEAGIFGAVESDFFDWVLHADAGRDLVLRIARQTAIFRLREVQSDVLKKLYESLIYPEQRKDLGEYYTPDWLASRLATRAIANPLTDRVLDPACGSGTFLFHAIRLLLAAHAQAGLPPETAVAAAAGQIRGVDVHPVAVILARVTWLLALGPAVEHRPAALHVPVFLGDSLQWNVRDYVTSRDVLINVPDDRPLHIPAGLAEAQAPFDDAVNTLQDGLADNATPAEIGRRLAAMPGVTASDATAMQATFAHLQTLYREGRDGIWPFVLRNLMRPLMLSRPDQKADILLGNPPWVAYRHLSPVMQDRVQAASRRMNLWEGGALSTQQDLCALFWGRAALLYLRPGGTIAFVMPYAALNRPAYAGLRRGDMRDVIVHIREAWSFDEHVRPLFPVPACALIGTRDAHGPLPATVTRYAGNLPRRDATDAEATAALTIRADAWPPIPTLKGVSPYRSRFRQGATIVPRRFFIVTREPQGRFGENRKAPRVRGRTGNLDKTPWKNVVPPVGPIEADFLRPVILGECFAPFRLLEPLLCIIPVENRGVLSAKQAGQLGHRHLAMWMRTIEESWNSLAAKNPDGQPKTTIIQNLNHLNKLTAQFPTSEIRVIYAKSGTLPSSAIVEDTSVLIDHSAYWASARSIDEARYLVAILNSDTARARVAPMQSRGQSGARDFHNLIWELPIPDFASAIPLHRDLAAAAIQAETIAAAVELPPTGDFRAARRLIRDALTASGIAARIDALVARLLDE